MSTCEMATNDNPANGAESDQATAPRPMTPRCSFLPLRRIFQKYLAHTPLAYTLFRAGECRRLARIEIQRPVLDVGCSVGEFPRFALEQPLDVGVDVNAGRLAVARAARAYKFVARADACNLPLATATFASVLCVSVCEHFAEPRAALAEAHRVLRPGGRFVATIVLADLHEYLFYPRLCRAMGLGRLGRRYVRLHDRFFQHVCLQSQAEWEMMLLDAGFRVLTSRRILSRGLVSRFDFWLVAAWPYRLWQRLGTPRVWRPRWFQRWSWEMFRRLDTDDEDKEGAVLLVVAEKA